LEVYSTSLQQIHRIKIEISLKLVTMKKETNYEEEDDEYSKMMGPELDPEDEMDEIEEDDWEEDDESDDDE
jgi:hypothetical protein